MTTLKKRYQTVRQIRTGYAKTLCLARLEDQHESGAIWAYLFPSTGLTPIG
jgi:hypothetical protein